MKKGRPQKQPEANPFETLQHLWHSTPLELRNAIALHTHPYREARDAPQMTRILWTNQRAAFAGQQDQGTLGAMRERDFCGPPGVALLQLLADLRAADRRAAERKHNDRERSIDRMDQPRTAASAA